MQELKQSLNEVHHHLEQAVIKIEEVKEIKSRLKKSGAPSGKSSLIDVVEGLFSSGDLDSELRRLKRKLKRYLKFLRFKLKLKSKLQRLLHYRNSRIIAKEQQAMREQLEREQIACEQYYLEQELRLRSAADKEIRFNPYSFRTYDIDKELDAIDAKFEREAKIAKSQVEQEGGGLVKFINRVFNISY